MSKQHTHTRTHTHTHTHTNAPRAKHTHRHTYMRTHMHTHAHTHARTCTYSTHAYKHTKITPTYFHRHTNVGGGVSMFTKLADSVVATEERTAFSGPGERSNQFVQHLPHRGGMRDYTMHCIYRISAILSKISYLNILQ